MDRSSRVQTAAASGFPRRWAWLAALGLVVALAAAARAQTPALTELQQARAQAHLLRLENAQLRAALAEAQAKLAEIELRAERMTLEADFRRQLHASSAAMFDWTGGRFIEPPGNTSPAAPKPPQ